MTDLSEQSAAHDIDKLYDEVKLYHNDLRPARRSRILLDPQHKSLLPKLRPYQADAVRWMLEQERYKVNISILLY